MDRGDRSCFVLALAYFPCIIAMGAGLRAGLSSVYKWGLEKSFKGHYNETLANVYVPPAYAFNTIYATISIAVYLFGVCAFFKSKIERKSPSMKIILQEIRAAVVDFSIMYFSMEIITLVRNLPQPIFLGYKKIVCTNNGALSIIVNTPAAEVNELCHPYPSTFCSAMTFCALYLHMYMGNLKIPARLHILRYLVVMGMWSACFGLFINLHKDEVVYLGDICMGVLIGVINVVVAMHARQIQIFKMRLEVTRMMET